MEAAQLPPRSCGHQRFASTSRRSCTCTAPVEAVRLPVARCGSRRLLQYDRLGFLLKLDSKLPAELATKYANFSEGACKPGYASALMTAIFPRLGTPRADAPEASGLVLTYSDAQAVAVLVVAVPSPHTQAATALIETFWYVS
ncbi:CMP-N-acetylneuraminate-beta-1,4-galactoside alpha-2,3-sialyltransferase [Myotis davidii]|uniref:CMP-N-acetylneuraminate-beta-1,4-galactoside alpha-2,3-sialyltransferase n=1 Tax=Myotis davidii TaxID=225400 RepID=L5LYK6_MYODS|nr:CMP-N-acetylneuraminate-beta-1,4-galactoside alpha-2,3-sialyltransferase [Myotis davidii]